MTVALTQSQSTAELCVLNALQEDTEVLALLAHAPTQSLATTVSTETEPATAKLDSSETSATTALLEDLEALAKLVLVMQITLSAWTESKDLEAASVLLDTEEMIAAPSNLMSTTLRTGHTLVSQPPLVS